jgi:hypothetical protein
MIKNGEYWVDARAHRKKRFAATGLGSFVAAAGAHRLW